MKKQLKILNLIDIPWKSALADYAANQAIALRKTGHKVYLGCPRKSWIRDFAQKEDFQTVDIPERKEIIPPKTLLNLSSFTKKEKVDILNSHTGKTATSAAIISAFNKNLKLIRTKSDAKKPNINIFGWKTSLIICGSENIKDMFPKSSQKKIKVIHKGAENIFSTPLPEKSVLKIGILARLDPVKGHSSLIDAILKVLQKKKNIQLHIAGKEENITWNSLRKKIPQKYLSHFVYHGHINDPYEFTASCHMGIVSSLASEAVSRAALEWISSSRMLLASDIGSLGEFVPQEFLFKPGNSDELAQKIIDNFSFEKIETEGLKNMHRTKNDFSKEIFESKTTIAFEAV